MATTIETFRDECRTGSALSIQRTRNFVKIAMVSPDLDQERVYIRKEDITDVVQALITAAGGAGAGFGNRPVKVTIDLPDGTQEVVFHG